jgi:hypothetical protein
MLNFSSLKIGQNFLQMYLFVNRVKFINLIVKVRNSFFFLFLIYYKGKSQELLGQFHHYQFFLSKI